jgi:hypothetical protein
VQVSVLMFEGTRKLVCKLMAEGAKRWESAYCSDHGQHRSGWGPRIQRPGGGREMGTVDVDEVRQLIERSDLPSPPLCVSAVVGLAHATGLT